MCCIHILGIIMINNSIASHMNVVMVINMSNDIINVNMNCNNMNAVDIINDNNITIMDNNTNHSQHITNLTNIIIRDNANAKQLNAAISNMPNDPLRR